MSTLALSRPELRHQPEDITALLAPIDNQAALDRVGGAVLTAAQMIREIEEYHKPRKAAAHGVWRNWCDQETALLNPWQEIKKAAGRLIAEYQAEQDRKRLIEEARQAEEQRKRDEETRLATAIQVEQLGASEADVDAILNEEPVPMAVALPRSYELPKGVGSAREYWSAEIADLSALVTAVAMRQVPIEALLPNSTFLNQQARSLKTALRYPGVRVVCRKDVPVRTR